MTQLRIVIFLLVQWPFSSAVHDTGQWPILGKSYRVGRSEERNERAPRIKR